MSRRASTSAPPKKNKGGRLGWCITKRMNMHDLSRDDDFCSYLLVEKIGNMSAGESPSGVPLVVHKMDAQRRLPRTDEQELLSIVRRVGHPHYPRFLPLTG